MCTVACENVYRFDRVYRMHRRVVAIIWAIVEQFFQLVACCFVNAGSILRNFGGRPIFAYYKTDVLKFSLQDKICATVEIRFYLNM